MAQLKPINAFTSTLPADPVDENYRRQVSQVAYSFVQPEHFINSEVRHTSSLTEELGWDPIYMDSKEFKAVFGSKQIIENSKPYAMAYAGHQFGNWAGQLGDGRAINLFQLETDIGLQTFQLKGAGPTPYSRNGDGYAVLRSSIREYLCAEAMHHLGIPTTRSLTIATTGKQVLRDVMYDGNPEYEQGAIVCRVAPSFIRFGNFELFAAQGDQENLRKLLDYTIEHHFPQVSALDKEGYLKFFEIVSQRTLDMIIHWQRVGFVHGVMNTDNMSILGLTIDYGPYGWLEPYDHGWTPNTTDRQHKRYRYGAQPEFGLWNLLQLANALYEIIDDQSGLEQVLDNYKIQYQEKHLDMMRNKLGFLHKDSNDQQLVTQLIQTLHLHEVDYTFFFRELQHLDRNMDTTIMLGKLAIAFYDFEQLSEPHRLRWLDWLSVYKSRIQLDYSKFLESKQFTNDDEDVVNLAFAKARSEKLITTNPKYVLRNYIAQQIIDEAEKGNYTMFHEVYRVLQYPYDEQPEFEKYYAKRPEWAKTKVGCSMLSCSS